MASAYSKLKVDFAKCAVLPFTNGTGSTIAGTTMRREAQKLGMVVDSVDDGETGLMIVGAPEPGIMVPKATGYVPLKGQPAYWDIADGNLNSDSNNPLVGYYFEDAATGDTTAQIVLTNENAIT